MSQPLTPYRNDYYWLMCGRYTYLFTWRQLQRLLGLVHWPGVELVPRFNVAPTQLAPVVRLNERGEREGVMLKWGLVPSWADDPSIGSRLVNARGETVFEKPAFRKAAKERRCLVPISGFYEWQAVEDEGAKGGRIKRPHWIGRADRQPLCVAGLWESWRAKGTTPDGEHLQTFTMLTTAPNDVMRPLHDRMPVILPPECWPVWLDPGSERSALEALIHPYVGNDLIAYPVGRRVNSPTHDEPGLIEPVNEPPPSLRLSPRSTRPAPPPSDRGLFDEA